MNSKKKWSIRNVVFASEEQCAKSDALELISSHNDSNAHKTGNNFRLFEIFAFKEKNRHFSFI